MTTNYDAFVGPSTGNQRIETLILDDNEGNILAIDREYIKADLAKFIGDNEQLMKELLAMKKIKYKKRKIKKLIEKYNAER